MVSISIAISPPLPFPSTLGFKAFVASDIAASKLTAIPLLPCQPEGQHIYLNEKMSVWLSKKLSDAKLTGKQRGISCLYETKLRRFLSDRHWCFCFRSQEFESGAPWVILVPRRRVAAILAELVSWNQDHLMRFPSPRHQVGRDSPDWEHMASNH